MTNALILQNAENCHIHFIGIGGIGMSGIAQVLVSLGFKVSGSDLQSSEITDQLEKLGVRVYFEHLAENIKGSTVIVYSSAVGQENPELQKAKALNIPILRRAEMLAEIMRLKFGIAVAGTHGKTTTSAMLATILKEAGLDPSYMIGGLVKNLEGHAKVGSGQYLVAEADESDGSFLLYNPILSIITNIDSDHLEYYGDMTNLENAFLNFANKIPFYGTCVLNAEDPTLMRMRKEIKRPSATISMMSDVEADYQARNIQYFIDKTKYDLYFAGNFEMPIEININGGYNVLNSLGAVALAHSAGVNFKIISKALLKFEGVGRRYNIIYNKNNIMVIDDYAHHPTAIQSVIASTRSVSPEADIIVVFEPHRYSRTKDCWNLFYHCFNMANRVILGPIYSASERNIPGITAKVLCEDINKIHPNLCEYRENLSEIDDLFIGSQKKRIILALGAGSISKVIRKKLLAMGL